MEYIIISVGWTKDAASLDPALNMMVKIFWPQTSWGQVDGTTFNLQIQQVAPEKRLGLESLQNHQPNRNRF